jgi:hypothetical protein
VGSRLGPSIRTSSRPASAGTQRDASLSPVHQIVRGLTNNVLADQKVEHVYELRDGVVWRMEIRT